MSWDYEDVRDHYVRKLFAIDPLDLRYSDPERALDLGRAAIAEAMTRVLSDWRRRDSPCAGALILSFRDLWPGSGWGLIDALGRPKAPWYALARVFAPRALLVSDEGLSGLRLHVFNDGDEPFSGTARLSVFSVTGSLVESVTEPVEIAANGALELAADRLLGGVPDLTRAYRFGPPSADVVLAVLEDSGGRAISEAFHLPDGARRPRLPDLGLEAALEQAADGAWSLRLSSRLFAQYVALDIPGFIPTDSWFHLAPGQTKTVGLRSVQTRHADPVATMRRC